MRKSGFSLSIHLPLGLVTGFILKGILTSFYSVAVVVYVVESPRKTCLEATKTAFQAERRKLFFGAGIREDSFVYSQFAVGFLLSTQGYMGYTEACMRNRLRKNIY